MDATHIELQALITEREGMLAANRIDEFNGNSVSYGPIDFYTLADKMRMLKELKTLIARLEAAERCCDLTYFYYGGGSEKDLTPMALELKQSSEAWRKAAGK